MRQFAGLLLLLIAIIGCSKPTLVGTWQSTSNPLAQFLVTVRADGTYTMLATSVGKGQAVMRFDGTYQPSGDSIQLNFRDVNLVGGDPTGDMANTLLLAEFLPGGAPSQLHLVDANSSQLTLAHHQLTMSRVTGQDISARTSADEKAVADESNKQHIVQGGGYTVHKIDVPPSDSNPVQPVATSPVATGSAAPTQQPATSASSIDNGMGQAAPPVYPNTSTTGGQDPTETTGSQTTGVQATGSNPPDPTNPPPGATGSTTGDASTGTSTGG